MNQTIAGKYPVFGVSYISPSFLRFSRAGSTGCRCGWLGSRSQPAGETVDPSAVNPQEEPGTIVIGYGPVGRTLTRLLRENKLNPTVIDLNYDSVQSLRRGSGRADPGALFRSVIYGKRCSRPRRRRSASRTT